MEQEATVVSSSSVDFADFDNDFEEEDSPIDLEDLDSQIHLMVHETYLSDSPDAGHGNSELISMMVVHVDADLVSNLQSILDNGDSVHLKALPETIREIRQAFGVAPPPAKAESIRALRTVVLKTEEETDECSICLEELREGVVKEVPCGHKYHGGCIQEWLRKHRCCPLCRFELLPSMSKKRRGREDDMEETTAQRTTRARFN